MVIFKVQCVELTKVHTKVMEAMQNILNSVLEEKSNQTTRLRARLHSKVCPSIRGDQVQLGGRDFRRKHAIGLEINMWQFYHMAKLTPSTEFCCSQRQKARVQLENCKAGCKLGRFSNWLCSVGWVPVPTSQPNIDQYFLSGLKTFVFRIKFISTR